MHWQNNRYNKTKKQIKFLIISFLKEFSNMCKTSNHAKTDIKRAVIVIFFDDPTGTADFVTTVCKSDSEIK